MTLAPAAPSDAECARLRALAARVPAHDATSLNGCGVVLARRGLLADGAALLGRALDADPRAAVAADNLRRLAAWGTLDRDTVAALEARLAAAPHDAGAARALARWRLRTGHPEAARPVLAARAAEPHADAALLRDLADVEHAAGDTLAALAWLDRALARAPHDATLHARRGELLYRDGRAAEARGALERALALAPDDAWAHQVLAFVLGDLGDTDGARTAASRALALDPSLARVEPQLALEPGRARGAVAPTASPGAGGAMAQLQLAVAYRNAGLHDQALGALAAAREQGADPGAVLAATAAVHALRGDRDAARAAAEQRVMAAPADAGAHATCAALRLVAGDVAGAAAAAADALALEPAHGAALLVHGVACAVRGDVAGALATMRRARGTARLETAARANAAWLLRGIGHAAPALEGFRRVTGADPRNVRALIGLGVALMDLRSPVEAIAALEEAARLETGEGGDAAHHLALALCQCGRWHEGLAALERALAGGGDFAPFRYELVLDPDVPDLVLTVPAGALVPHDDAQALLERARRTPHVVAAVHAEARRVAFTGTPAGGAAPAHGAWVALRRGATPPGGRTPTRALRHVPTPPPRAATPRRTPPWPLATTPADDETALRALVAREPDAAQARTALAARCRATGRDDEAEAQLRRALEAVPTYRDAALALAELLVDTDRAADALAVLVRPLRADDADAALLVAACDALLAQGRDAQALYALRLAARLAPDDAGVRTLLGWHARRDGRTADAVAHWERAASDATRPRWSARARAALREVDAVRTTPVVPLATLVTGGRR